MARKVTILTLREKKERQEKISMLTAYDYPIARLVDDAGVDIILVGDSLGMVVLGYENTLAVTVEDMIHHGRAVVRGTSRALVVVDMPFLSYHVSDQEAVRNAGRIIQETGAQAVKVEGGQEIGGAVSAIIRAGIPVMGHLGLTPQAVHQLGGFRVQGQSEDAARKIVQDALALEKLGVFSLVLESVPWQLAKHITEHLSIPTIGIGAGVHCDGQVLVTHDLLGMFDRFVPRFVKKYADMRGQVLSALRTYIQEVQDGSFPGEEHSVGLSPEVVSSLFPSSS